MSLSAVSLLALLGCASGFVHPATGTGNAPQRMRHSVSSLRMQEPEGFGASHTSFYTDMEAKDSYESLAETLEKHMADDDTRQVVIDMLDACQKITVALRENLVTVADNQNSVFGDVQLTVDVIADDLMWDAVKESKVCKYGASEEEPEVKPVSDDDSGRYTVCWDPLDGSSIVDNNWAVGTIMGIWDETTGLLGATGRDQVTSIVTLYGPRTTALVACDDGVYEFTLSGDGQWLCSRESIQIKKESKIFAPANMRAAQEVPEYKELLEYWMQNKYTLRYSGGLVPDVYQQFTKNMGVFANPTSKASPAKIRLAFEAAPFALLVEKAGGKSSECVSGDSVLDVQINAVDQRTALCIGSADEVDRFNDRVLAPTAEPALSSSA